MSALKSMRICTGGLRHVRGFCTSKKLVDIDVNSTTGIATVTMQRPPVNSLNYELLTELSQTLSTLESNRTRGMILTSSSPTVFSAGLDIMEMYKPDKDRVRAFWGALQDTWLKLYGSTFPTVAAINGHSPAGGCLLSMSCEYRVMVPKFTIGLNETKLGIVAPSWFIASMNNTISKRATELALTSGTLFTTDEALKIGLIDEVATDKNDAIAKATKFFERFANVHPMARQLTKMSIRKNDLAGLMEHRDEDMKQFLFFVNQPKVQQGLETYIETLKKKGKQSA